MLRQGGGFRTFGTAPCCSFRHSELATLNVEDLEKYNFECYSMTDWRAMSQNMPLLSRVLGTAALASRIFADELPMGPRSPMTQVIRLHPK